MADKWSKRIANGVRADNWERRMKRRYRPHLFFDREEWVEVLSTAYLPGIKADLERNIKING